METTALRNFGDIKADKYDEEGLVTVTSQDQVRHSLGFDFILIVLFRFYLSR